MLDSDLISLSLAGVRRLEEDNGPETKDALHSALSALCCVPRAPHDLMSDSVRSHGLQPTRLLRQRSITVFWPGEFHGLYSIVCGVAESHRTEQLSLSLLD